MEAKEQNSPIVVARVCLVGHIVKSQLLGLVKCQLSLEGWLAPDQAPDSLFSGSGGQAWELTLLAMSRGH
jgi:hypothetical protein